MPPSSKTTALERERRLVCAINALRRNQISSIKEASRIYRVNYDTLRHRLQGRPPRAETVANGRNLDDDEEQTLTEWILDLAARGYPPRKWMVEDTANMLRQLRGKPPVGKCWVKNYVKRTPEVQIAQSKKYDYQRAKKEDPEVIKEHFRLLKNVANKHGIQDEDIYNMDEIGFLRGDIGTATVVTAADGPRYHIQPGDRDWMTVIECINAAKRRIPAMVIAKGKVFQNIWFDEDAGLPDD
ncbi:DDE superfamily endonuclease CENP-B-like protein [Macrophomina phaseolina MS6]|uniref:DDE superfamily endonuclease CENP-B-like protein n=1 Tax=Macrophomina phaseolina (strain MS6) TaxID=1126212 RepID=K2R4S1_MACPH|nr:DDE superfamily endonuclease CENP-B-like protein [Macrophomina phaseolina MS6]